MLIRYKSRPFVFVANVKTGSTSIERTALARAADIAITRTSLGKHAWVGEIEDRFGFMFEGMPRTEFFWFGVIRDPVDWVVSWYNFRSREALSRSSHPNHRLYAGDLTLEEFWEQQKSDPGLVPQSERFSSATLNRCGLDYLIDMSDLSGGLATVADILGTRIVRVPKRNASSNRIDVVSPAMRRKLADHYASDYQLLENRAVLNEAGLERVRTLFADQPSAALSIAGLRERVRARLRG